MLVVCKHIIRFSKWLQKNAALLQHTSTSAMVLLSGQNFWWKRLCLFKKKKNKKKKKVLSSLHRAEIECFSHVFLFCFTDPVTGRPGEAEVPEAGFVSQPLSSHRTWGNHSAIMIDFVTGSKSKCKIPQHHSLAARMEMVYLQQCLAFRHFWGNGTNTKISGSKTTAMAGFYCCWTNVMKRWCHNSRFTVLVDGLQNSWAEHALSALERRGTGDPPIRRTW